VQAVIDRYARLLKGGAFLLVGASGIVGAFMGLVDATYERIRDGHWHFPAYYEVLRIAREKIPQLLMPVFGLPAVVVYAGVGSLLIWQGWRIFTFVAPENQTTE